MRLLLFAFLVGSVGCAWLRSPADPGLSKLQEARQLFLAEKESLSLQLAEARSAMLAEADESLKSDLLKEVQAIEQRLNFIDAALAAMPEPKPGETIGQAIAAKVSATGAKLPGWIGLALWLVAPLINLMSTPALKPEQEMVFA